MLCEQYNVSKQFVDEDFHRLCFLQRKLSYDVKVEEVFPFVSSKKFLYGYPHGSRRWSLCKMPPRKEEKRGLRRELPERALVVLL